MTLGFTVALIAILALVAFVLRGAFILFLPGLPLPRTLERSLRYVAPAVFAALVVPELLVLHGSLTLSPGNEKLLAGIGAGIVAWRTRNTLATVLVGMAILYGLRYLPP